MHEQRVLYEKLRDYLSPRVKNPDLIEVDDDEMRIRQVVIQYVFEDVESPQWKLSFPVIFYSPYDRKSSTTEIHPCDDKNDGLPHKNTLAAVVKYLNWYLERLES